MCDAHLVCISQIKNKLLFHKTLALLSLLFAEIQVCFMQVCMKLTGNCPKLKVYVNKVEQIGFHIFCPSPPHEESDK